MIRATVPTDVPREPLPVNVTVGTIVRAKLSVITSDATVTPLRIPVRPMATPGPGVGGWVHGVVEGVKNYWVQLTPRKS